MMGFLEKTVPNFVVIALDSKRVIMKLEYVLKDVNQDTWEKAAEKVDSLFYHIAGYFSRTYFWPILVNFKNLPKFKSQNDYTHFFAPKIIVFKEL